MSWDNDQEAWADVGRARSAPYVEWGFTKDGSKVPPYLPALHNHVLSRVAAEAPRRWRCATEHQRRQYAGRLLQALCWAHHKPLRAAYRFGGHKAVVAILPELLDSDTLPWEVALW